jgi:hypothetical protein
MGGERSRWGFRYLIFAAAAFATATMVFFMADDRRPSRPSSSPPQVVGADLHEERELRLLRAALEEGLLAGARDGLALAAGRELSGAG